MTLLRNESCTGSRGLGRGTSKRVYQPNLHDAPRIYRGVQENLLHKNGKSFWIITIFMLFSAANDKGGLSLAEAPAVIFHLIFFK